MKQQPPAKPLPQKTIQILNSQDYAGIAQLIAEAPSYPQSVQLIRHILSLEDTAKWSQVKEELKGMLVVNPEKMYISDHFVSKDKLMLIRDIFKNESTLDQNYFRTESGFVLLAVSEGYLSQQDMNEQNVQKTKQFFARNLKKDSSFFGLHHLENLQLHITDPSTGYFSTFNATQHELQLDRFKYFMQFNQTYPGMFPQSCDIQSIYFKIMMCLREERERDRALFAKIKQIYFQSRYHFQTTLKNMKFILQFFRNTYNDKESLYFPQRSLNSVLQKYSQDQILNLLEGSWLGLRWNYGEVHNFFITCIKMGITSSTTKLMISMIKFCEKHYKYSELGYAYEENINRLFIFLKHPKLFDNTAKLLKYFMYSPAPQIQLYQKFTEKALALSQLISLQIKFPFLNILQTVAYLYKDTTTVNDLTMAIDTLIGGEEVHRLTEEEMKAEIQLYKWKTNFKGKIMNYGGNRPAGYRGLINIGNSCYLNSFLQALFMNREFTRQILTVSTLELQREKLKDPNNKEKDAGKLSKTIRQDLRPLAQLQRIFALLQTSKKTQITPLPIRNIAPQEFRNNYQHDTLQFGRFYLDMLYKNKINRIFEGQMITSIECQACKNIRERKQIFLDLIVTPQKDQEDLSETIETAFANEIIHDLVCDFCHERRDNSIKRLRLSKIPNYLIISIKRFHYSVQEKKNHKILSKINIPPTIILNTQEYDLYSLIIHRGPSPNAGHYFEFSKCSYEPNSKWICHNDSQVSQLEGYKEVTQFLENNESDTPYILFFERRAHINNIKEQLMKPIVLRKPLEDYVNRDYLEQQKAKEKKPLLLYNPFNFASLFKKGDDDEDEGGGQNPSFYNNYVL